MAKAQNNTVSVNVMEKIVAFVARHNRDNGAGAPAGAIEYVGGFSAKEIKATAQAGMIVARKGTGGGFYPADSVPENKGKVAAATVKNQMAAFLETLHTGMTITPDMTDTVSKLLGAYKAQNARRRKSQ
jgi:hypothetical protein